MLGAGNKPESPLKKLTVWGRGRDSETQYQPGDECCDWDKEVALWGREEEHLTQPWGKDGFPEEVPSH